MKIEDLRHKKILILGFGLEGQATLRFLRYYFPDKPANEISTADQKDGPDYLERQKDCDVVVKTAGIPRKLVTKPYTTGTDLFFEQIKGSGPIIIGITGSKGKSTTSSLIYSILKEAGKKVVLAGNIGKPLLDELGDSVEPADIYVCELSSYQTEDLHYSPDISVYVSFFPDHMDYHGGLEAYWLAKKNLVAHAGKNDSVVYNPSYEHLRLLAEELVSRSETGKPKVIPFMDELPFSADIVPLLGKHNLDNIRGACTVAKLFSIDSDTMARAVHNFQALPHRLQPVGTFKGISFYDDAISTTPESAIAAVRALPQGIHSAKIGTIMLGGKDRGYDFGKLAESVVKSDIRNIVLFPESGDKIEAALREAVGNAVHKLDILRTKSMEEAVKYAYRHTKSGDICLLSTASPSYGIWKNFEEKGDEFQKWVKDLGAQAI